MAPIRERYARGKRLIGKVPFGRWTITTFVPGLRHDGATAPFVITAAINGPSFLRDPVPGSDGSSIDGAVDQG